MNADKHELPLPSAIAEIIRPDSLIEISIGESCSNVFKLSLTDGSPAYLKTSTSHYVAEELSQEVKLLQWLRPRLSVPEMLSFVRQQDTTWFLMTAIAGENLAEASKHLAPETCLSLGARFMRKMHSIPIKDCPFNRRLPVTLKLAEDNLNKGLVDETDFDATGTFLTLSNNIPKAQEDPVLTHGDFCFPNLIVQDGNIHGTIDLSRAGIADRYQDIALFLCSFDFNLGKPELDVFTKEYGLINSLDPEKLKFYKILDEFF